MTMFKPPRRIVLKLGTGIVIVTYDPPQRFGPRIVNEGPSRPQRREAPDPRFGNDEA